MTQRREVNSRSSGAVRGILVLGACLFPWLLLIAHLQTFWTLAPDYEYGWVVLPLAVYFFFRRWTSLGPIPPTGGKRGAKQVMAACAFAILPIWWLGVATPDWSVVNYSLTGAVILYTLALLADLTSWEVARRMIFPICFVLCAVPWPQQAENALVQGLTKVVTAGSVEALQWLGIGAFRQGNLVSLGIGAIGISDACSGIRSLQSMLVAGLTIGELFSLRMGRRIALLAVSFALAMALNLVRTTTLAIIAQTHGVEALERWHDRAGWTILVISLPLVYLLGRRWQTSPPPASVGVWPNPRRMPAWSAAAFVAWFSLVVGGVEVWYRAHENRRERVRHLQVRWPEHEQDFTRTPIDDLTRDALLCSEGEVASWTSPDGSHWAVSAMEWEPGRTSAQTARVHRPEVCYTATGAQFLADNPPEIVAIPGGSVTFEPMEFLKESNTIYLFYCLHEDANHDDPNDYLQTRMSRLQHAWHGQRNRGQQLVELCGSGFPDYAAALEALRKEAPAILSLTTANSR